MSQLDTSSNKTINGIFQLIISVVERFL